MRFRVPGVSILKEDEQEPQFTSALLIRHQGGRSEARGDSLSRALTPEPGRAMRALLLQGEADGEVVVHRYWIPVQAGGLELPTQHSVDRRVGQPTR